jgi:hypothetical protein
MLTDAAPRRKSRELFGNSDRMKDLTLPDDGRLQRIAASLEGAMKREAVEDVRRSCAEFLTVASDFYRVPMCSIRVLAARPLRVRERSTIELFGDYQPGTKLIRVWMKTAVRRDVTSFGTFLSTLCHEFCHHLDFERFGFRNSWHTRGFYERTAALYHHSRMTPPKRIFCVPVRGGRWRVDWSRMNRGRRGRQYGSRADFRFLCCAIIGFFRMKSSNHR